MKKLIFICLALLGLNVAAQEFTQGQLKGYVRQGWTQFFLDPLQACRVANPESTFAPGGDYGTPFTGIPLSPSDPASVVNRQLGNCWSPFGGLFDRYECPVGSTPRNNNRCEWPTTCPTNQPRDPVTGQCTPPPDPCTNTQGLTTGYSSWKVVFDNVNPTPAALGTFVGQAVKAAVPIGGNNCAATGVVSSCALFGTSMTCDLSNTTYTGATFDGEQTLFGLPKTDPNATPEENLAKVCPTGQVPGEVNGTQVCVKSSGSATSTQSTTTNPDGTSTTTTTTTACVGDQCSTTTTTTTKDAQGNTTGSGTSSTSGDKDQFCIANPEAPECKNTKSTFDGTCKNDFRCESNDVVQCAIALDQYRTNCELLAKPDRLGEDLENLIGDELRGLDINTFTIERPNAPSGSSCSITPFSIQVGMGSFVVDFTHLCPYLGIIRAIVTAFGFVMWTLIVFVRQ